MGQRRLAREFSLQALYLADIGCLNEQELFAAIEHADTDLDEESLSFARSLISGTLSNLNTIDSAIQECAKNWRIGRMPVIDKCILRLGVYEILVSAQVPPIAVIDEDIELAKKYSTENSGRFINGILDRIREKGTAAGDTPK